MIEYEMQGSTPIPDWLPPGKRAAICFSIDDVYPAISTNGDSGPLAHLGWLLDRHQDLRVTLFATADWRQTSPHPTRRLLAGVPLLRDRSYASKLLPKGSMRLDRQPDFVRSLQQLPRVEIGLHGLHHVSRGPGPQIEFAGLDFKNCRRILRKSIAIFTEAKIQYVLGMTPPGWELSANLADAMIDAGLEFVASARDIRSPVSRAAVTNMSGLKDVSLIYPQLICKDRLLHLTSNFQATSDVDRAIKIIEHGGLLAIKAHSVKRAGDYVALDGLDELYRNYLDLLFARLRDTYGETLWWTSMGEISDRVRAGKNLSAESLS
jgi:hypothetical protein